MAVLLCFIALAAEELTHFRWRFSFKEQVRSRACVALAQPRLPGC